MIPTRKISRDPRSSQESPSLAFECQTFSPRTIIEPEILIVACSGDGISHREELALAESTYEPLQTRKAPGRVDRPIPQFLVPGGFPIEADYSRIADLINIHPGIVNIGVYTHADSCGMNGAIASKITNPGETLPVFDDEVTKVIHSFAKYGLLREDILELVKKTGLRSVQEKIAMTLAKTVTANLAHDLIARTPVTSSDPDSRHRETFAKLRISARAGLENGGSEVVVPLTSIEDLVRQSPILPPKDWARRAANGQRPSAPKDIDTLGADQGMVLQRSAPAHVRP